MLCYNNAQSGVSPRNGSGVPDRLGWGREDSDLDAVAEVELDDLGIPSHGFCAQTVILRYDHQYEGSWQFHWEVKRAALTVS